MPEFRCPNPECSEYGKKEFYPKVRFIFNEKTLKLEAKEAICKICGCKRELTKETGDIKLPWFKAENAKNYDNKSIKKYDYDHAAHNAETHTISTKKKK